jgi:hypothetical protein
MSEKSHGARSQLVGRSGKYFVIAELNKRGAFAVPIAGHIPKLDIIACNRDQNRTVYINKVVTKRGGKTWHSSIADGESMTPKDDERNFWVFVDLGDKTEYPRYWIVPEWWIKDNIYRTHQEYLNRHGGTRPKNPESEHHSIDESRLAQWRDRWDILGIFE